MTAFSNEYKVPRAREAFDLTWYCAPSKMRVWVGNADTEMRSTGAADPGANRPLHRAPRGNLRGQDRHLPTRVTS
jgi:hypothetical protein